MRCFSYVVWIITIFQHNQVCADLLCFRQNKIRKRQDSYSYFFNFASLILWLYCTCASFHQSVDISHIQNMTVCPHEVWLSLSENEKVTKYTENRLILSWDKTGIFENYTRIFLLNSVWSWKLYILYTPCGLRLVACFSPEAESTTTLRSNVDWHYFYSSNFASLCKK